MTKRKRKRASGWITIITGIIVVASNTWTVSYEIGRLEEKLDNLIREFRESKVNIDKIPVIEFQNTQMERRFNNLESRVDAVEKK